ncbi:TPA: hypothetical protein ACVU4Q_004953, partial [Vibrio parahaemolyticus]
VSKTLRILVVFWWVSVFVEGFLMRFNCECGARIHDISDYQENKARFIPDECWEEMCEQIDGGMNAWEAFAKYQRFTYQCHNCSRVIIEQGNGGFISFKPEQDIPFGVLKYT